MEQNINIRGLYIFFLHIFGQKYELMVGRVKNMMIYLEKARI